MDGLTTDVLTDWMTRQRWYAGKGRVPQLREVGSFRLTVDEPGVTAGTWLLLDESGAVPVLYQVPLTVRTTIPRGWGTCFIGRIGEEAYLFDGVQDPAFTSALLRLVTGGAVAESRGVQAHGVPAAGVVPPIVTEARVLSGEQSNTSIVYTLEGAGPVICKVFRTLHHGDNPDVVLQSAISASGSTRVPEVIGSLVGEWDDPGRPGGRATGHLAFAQEFLAGVEDAWRVALRAASAGEDFRDDARELGRATAEVHRVLAERMPTREPSIGDVAAMVSAWHQRLAAASAEVPELARHQAEVQEVYAAAQATPWPRMQRIHGDYHLGQVLLVPERGWVLLDFEGEPLRPMHERDRLDEPLRDVAGMLRSFDYVAGSVALGGADARAWAADARAAFLSGYVEGSGVDLAAEAALLDAFEIDKALYEAVYEARNRPDWLPIPVAAVTRLVEAQRPTSPPLIE